MNVSDEIQVHGKFTLIRGYTFVRILLTGLLILPVIISYGQKFPASAIPDSLKKNANVVIRLEENVLEIKSAEELQIRRHYVYTILNEKGDGYAEHTVVYNNKSIQLNSMNGYLYDAAGKELRHFKKKDTEDHPYEDGVAFVNDERYKKGSFSYQTYPYTVEFEDEIDLTGFMSLRGWEPQDALSESVEVSRYQIIAPATYDFRYRMLNATIEPAYELKGDKKTYTWQVDNLVAFEEMPFSDDFVMYTPHLLIAFGNIHVQDFKGSMTSWNEFGKFYGSMQRGRDVLPEETRQKVHELTKGIPDVQGKVAALYSYMQQNTHYVNIQLGIGGWQTSEASYVATRKYGDCKALSNFMVALLKEAGIKGHAVVITGGEENMDFVVDFTNDPFNHVICCVPLEKDTIWLECTDQYLPPGYLSNFTSNRYGLLIDDNGGSLVHTPAYLLPDNLRMRKISAVLDPEGNLMLDCSTMYKSYCQDAIEKDIHHNSREDLLKTLKSKFNLPTYDVISFNYQEDYSRRLPVINETLRLNVNNYAQVTAKRIFINPNVMARLSEKLLIDKDRRLGVAIKHEFRYVDSVQISVPTGYEIESRPSDLELTGKFGKYINRTVIKGDKIIFYRLMEQYSGRFPAKDYSELVTFFNQIYDADHTSMVLVKRI